MTTKLPTTLLECININVTKEFIQIKEKQKQLFNSKLIHLWYTIYSCQVDDYTESLKYFTNISRDNLSSFKFNFKCKRYQYNDLINYLVAWGLIEVNHKYRYNKDKSKHESFTKSYRVKTGFLKNTNMSEVKIDFEKIFGNTRNKEFWLEKYPNYTSMIQDCYNTTIDLDGFVHWLYENEGMELKYKMIKGSVVMTYLTTERIIRYINQVLKFHYKNLWFKISDEGRFYSSLTNLPSKSIKFLKLNGKKLVELDVKNCQPLLLSYLINHPAYKIDVENGVFYDKMAKALDLKRVEFKLFSYRYIFFPNTPLKSGKIYNTLNNHYPGLIGEINNLKKETNLALTLQKLESDIFVQKIGKLPFGKITRHDSVLVLNENSAFFEMCIKKEFSKLGLKVNVEEKKYLP